MSDPCIRADKQTKERTYLPPDMEGPNTIAIPPATTTAPIYWNLLYCTFSKYLEIIILIGIAAWDSKITNGPERKVVAKICRIDAKESRPPMIKLT